MNEHCVATINEQQFSVLMKVLGGGPSLLEQISWLSQAMVLLVAVAAAAFAYSQIITMHKFEILRYLQDPHLVSARRVVRSQISKSDDNVWWTDPVLESAASSVCVSYDIVARMTMHTRGGLFGNRRVFLPLMDIWANSILSTYKTLYPFIEYRRRDNGNAYLAGYTWLYEKAKTYDQKRHR